MTLHLHSSNGGEWLWQTNVPYLCAVYSNAHKVKTFSRPRLDYQLVLMWFFQKIIMHVILLKEYWSTWNKNAEGLHIRKIIEHSFMWQNIYCHNLDCVCRRQRAYPYSHISLTPFSQCVTWCATFPITDMVISRKGTSKLSVATIMIQDPTHGATFNSDIDMKPFLWISNDHPFAVNIQIWASIMHV